MPGNDALCHRAGRELPVRDSRRPTDGMSTPAITCRPARPRRSRRFGEKNTRPEAESAGPGVRARHRGNGSGAKRDLERVAGREAAVISVSLQRRLPFRRRASPPPFTSETQQQQAEKTPKTKEEEEYSL